MTAIYADLPPETTGFPSPLGIELAGDTTPRLHFEPDVHTDAPESRHTTDLLAVAREPDAISKASMPQTLYHVYRNVRTTEAMHEEVTRRGLCYTLMVLRDGTIHDTPEWVRTRGHTNSLAPGTNLPYPEIHELLHGEACLYLQHGVTDGVDDVVILPLRAGDKAVVAPGWASLLANVGAEPLVVGTWRMGDCHTEHTELVAQGGMAHFLVRGGNGTPLFEANNRYKVVPEPRIAAPKELPDWGLTRAEPLLAAFHRSPESLRCLLRPQDFADVWKTLYD
ncbi:MAG: hypothetical protein H8F28_27045 [Fibrella sp.]|nr:hypothetical protein [Armatimonadota bacterium]